MNRHACVMVLVICSIQLERELPLSKIPAKHPIAIIPTRHALKKIADGKLETTYQTAEKFI